MERMSEPEYEVKQELAKIESFHLEDVSVELQLLAAAAGLKVIEHTEPSCCCQYQEGRYGWHWCDVTVTIAMDCSCLSDRRV